MDQPRLFEEPQRPEGEPPPSAGAAEQPLAQGRVRVQPPERYQIVMREASLDELLPREDLARVMWDFVVEFGQGGLYDKIRAVEGGPGRPPIDPRILLALWLLATVKNIGSARELDRQCREHIAFQWLCGGVSVNYHTLADFRVQSGQIVEKLLADQLACLMQAGIVTLERVSQDGMRVRASAGTSSFRREPKLRELRDEALQHLLDLKAEQKADPGAGTRRERAAQERAAEQRVAKLQKALEASWEVKAQREERGCNSKPENARGSMTDAEARVMKMGDGGFRPAYNTQYATDNETQVIVGVDVVNAGSDNGQMVPVVEQIEERTGRQPDAMFVDGGFATLEDIEQLEAAGVQVYAPVKDAKKIRSQGGDPFAKRKGDKAGVTQWRQRMGTPEAQDLYHERAATAECVNALARNRGLRQFVVRGLDKVRVIAFWFAIAHNVLRMAVLRADANKKGDEGSK